MIPLTIEDGRMVAWGDLLVHPREGDHLVQLYGNDDQLLATHVGRYLAEGLRRLDGLVVIATPAHARPSRATWPTPSPWARRRPSASAGFDTSTRPRP